MGSPVQSHSGTGSSFLCWEDHLAFGICTQPGCTLNLDMGKTDRQKKNRIRSYAKSRDMVVVSNLYQSVNFTIMM